MRGYHIDTSFIYPGEGFKTGYPPVNAIEFCGLWEQLHKDFKRIEFEAFKIEAGSQIEITNAIGIFSKSGMYGGTFAHLGYVVEYECG